MLTKTRDDLITDALRLCELWGKPWSDIKGAELKSLGIVCLNPEHVIDRVRELLCAAETAPREAA